MLVHICCAVDSHYFLQKLQTDYPDEELIGFFYDPNIHPYSEYRLRLLDVKRSCGMLGIKLIEGEYDTQGWLKVVRGFEKEPEKGARCSICFDNRFEVSAKKAQELRQASFTSTLLTSPKKSLKQLQKSGDELASKYNLAFIAPDYRKASGTQEQNTLAKKDALYRQDYCGCLFGLTMQREHQHKLADELFSSISGRIEPESIEERIALYEKRLELEAQGINYKIIKERFLNYRLLRAGVTIRKNHVDAHFLPYSTLKSEYTRGNIEFSIDEVYYLGRSEVCFVTLEYYNKLANRNYASVTELIYNPPSFEQEVVLRHQIIKSSYSLGVVIVVKAVEEKKIEIYCQSKSYEDVKEVLLEL